LDPVHYTSYHGDSDGMTTTEGGRHRHSTSQRYARKRVQVKLTDQRIMVLDESLRPVVKHRRMYGSVRQESMD
jgi:hypothetical protein